MKPIAVLIAGAIAVAAYSMNAASRTGLPPDWKLGGEAPQLYSAELDVSDSPSGRGSVMLRRIETSHPYGNATLLKSFDAKDYAGKRVRLSMHMRSQSELPTEGKTFLVTDNTTHAMGQSNSNWWWFKQVVTFPHTLRKLEIGMVLKGPGSVRVDDINLEIIGESPADQKDTKFEANKKNEGTDQ